MSEGVKVIDSPRTLVEGQRLDQPTFHALYEAMPPGTRAELIDGVVYMPSPLGTEHGVAQVSVIYWLACYVEKTPGVQAMDNATAILGKKSEPQPDGLLRIVPECGGRTRNKGAYLQGPPELVVEVAKASRYIDLGPKLAVYQNAGVLEYMVARWNPTRSSGSAANRTCLCSNQSAGMGSIGPRRFQGSGSIRVHSLPATFRVSAA